MTTPLDDRSARHRSPLIIASDPQDLARTRAQKAYRLNVLQIPALRLLGFSLLGLGALLHNLFLLEPFSWASVVHLVAILILYPLLSWLILYLFFERVKALNLGSCFLVFDIFIYVLIVYFTGGDKSWLFFLVLSRVADQTNTSFRKILVYAHISIVSYVLMLIYVMSVEHHAIAWLGESSKIAVLYGVSLYLALATRTVEQRHLRTSDAIRVARELILQLEEQSQQLAASKSTVEQLSRHNELILGSAGEGIYGVDLQGNSTFVNPAAARISGYAVEELLGQPMHTRLHHAKEDGTPYLWEASPIFASLTTGAVHRVSDGVLWRKDGTSFPIEYMSTPIREGERIVGAVVTFNDITERKRTQTALRLAHDELDRRVRDRTAALAKANTDLRGEMAERQRAEKALREQHSLLQVIVEGTTDAIFVKDLEGRYLMINSAGARFLGKPMEAILGKDDTEVFSPNTARAIIEGDRAVMRSGETRTYEELGTSVGITRTYLSTKGVYRDHQGNIIGLFGIARDITERKHLEDQLRQSQKMEAIGRLAARVAHEVNNPLAIIKTAIRIIRHQSQAGDPRIEYLQMIDDEVSRIARIIQELLTFSRPMPTQDLVQVNAVIQNLQSVLTASLREQRIELKATLEPELPLVRFSADQFKQVLLNLVCNAADAMPHGGELMIRTACEGPSVEVSISDNGCGIPEEHLNHLFDPFFTTKEREKGLGLGLSVSYEIIQAANGRIEVDSEVGKGSTFRVSLPAAAEPEGGRTDG
ncbi:MAG TPA: PAS domain S-box protein [Candidatus Tectomicrobia bacterium]